ncbi:MAG: ribonuclease HII [Limisphaerales bacterium]
MARASQPTDRFEFERILWNQGVTHVAGVDEAGRGPLAGPVLAAAAILPSHWAKSGLPRELEGLNDSKQLTEIQRERFYQFITACGEIEFAIAQVNAPLIDKINILQATHRAMNDALAKLNPPPQHALVDGRPVKTMRVPQTAIVKGDAREFFHRRRQCAGQGDARPADARISCAISRIWFCRAQGLRHGKTFGGDCDTRPLLHSSSQFCAVKIHGAGFFYRQ